MSPIIGILLAAGNSKRFGSNKLMHPLSDGEPVAVHACRNLMVGVDEVLAVVRPGSDALAEHLQAEGAVVQVCVDAEQGMGSSLAFGIAAHPEAMGWLVALADMPWIAPSTIIKLTAALREGAMIAAPCWQGQRGHPVGFAKALRQSLLELTGDVGAKSIIQTHGSQLRLLSCDDPGVMMDIDQPADLNKRHSELFL